MRTASRIFMVIVFFLAVTLGTAGTANALTIQLDPTGTCSVQQPESNAGYAYRGGILCGVYSFGLPFGYNWEPRGSANPWKACWDTFGLHAVFLGGEHGYEYMLNPGWYCVRK